MTKIKRSVEHNKTGKLTFDGMPKIRLLTNSGLFLWHGRQSVNGSKYIMGFQTFLKKIKSLEIAARNDDPYADRHLVKVELWLNEAQASIKELNQDLQTILDSHHSRLIIPPSLPSHEVEVVVSEHSKIGWLSLELLLETDDAIKRILDASHTARISHEEKRKLLREAEGICRHMMRSTYDWRFTGVTRTDVIQKNMKAKEAEALMGEIEREFIEGVLRSEYAPPLKPYAPIFSTSAAPTEV